MTDFKRNLIGLSLVVFSIGSIYLLNDEGPTRIFINLMAFAGIYAISAIGLNIHFGWTGLINFGHAAFMGVGAYTTILLIPHAAGREGSINEEGLPLFLAILIGLVASAIFGLVIGLPAIRLRGDYLAIVTIASSEIFSAILVC